MGLQGQESTPEQKELTGVSVIFHNITERIQSWVDAVVDAGATIYEEGSDSIIEAQEHTTLKVAVIIGLAADENRLQEIIEEHSWYFGDPVISVRYFLFVEQGQIPSFSHEKLRLVTYRDMAPNNLPKRINISLYKARLPHFLRTGYDVEILDEVVELEQVRYRKVIIRSFKEWNQIEYQSLYLFIHNKELYEIINDTVRVIWEGNNIFVRKGEHLENNVSRFDGRVTLSLLRNAETQE